MLEKLDKIHSEIVEIRRYLHQHPEVSFKEVNTRAYIAKYLEDLNIPVKREVGGGGVVAYLKGAGEGKTVALRADFDALSLTDEKDVPYKSQNPGAMHACGHDGHTASLLAVGKVLSQNPDQFKGEVRLLFQHAEEQAPGGAEPMIKDGCLEGVDFVFGSHLKSDMPVGKFGYRIGAALAAADEFNLTIQGKGGHGAAPQNTIDPIIISAKLINDLQHIISRRKDPQDPAVLTIGTINGGSAFNIIPDRVKMSGTVRTYDKKVQDFIIEEMEKIIKANCDSYGATYTFNYIKGYPPLINHKAETEKLVASLAEIVGSENVSEMAPSMGGEDFSRYLEKVPGSFFYTGAGNEAKGIVYPHHHPKFDIDEDGLLFAAKGLLKIAVEYTAS